MKWSTAPRHQIYVNDLNDSVTLVIKWLKGFDYDRIIFALKSCQRLFGWAVLCGNKDTLITAFQSYLPRNCYLRVSAWLCFCQRLCQWTNIARNSIVLGDYINRVSETDIEPRTFISLVNISSVDRHPPSLPLVFVFCEGTRIVFDLCYCLDTSPSCVHCLLVVRTTGTWIYFLL